MTDQVGALPAGRVAGLVRRMEKLAEACEQLEMDRAEVDRQLVVAKRERDAVRRQRDRLTREGVRVQISGQNSGTGARRLSLNKTEAASALGVSVDFFDAHIAEELRCVRRGRRRLYPITELERWLDESAERAYYPDNAR